jgi:hypothetical protein
MRIFSFSIFKILFSFSLGFGLDLSTVKANLSSVAALDTIDANIELTNKISGFSSKNKIHLIQAGKSKMWLEMSMPNGIRQRIIQNGTLMKITDFSSGKSEIVPAKGISKSPMAPLQGLFDKGQLVSIESQGNSLFKIKMNYPEESNFIEQTFVYSESKNQIIEIHTHSKEIGKSKTTIEYCDSCEIPFPFKMTIESVDRHEYYQIILDFVSISSPKSFPKNLFLIQ